jgi:lysozyme family protein
MSIEAIIEGVISREGGFVDHPADRGGPTNFGITQASWSAYIGRPATVEDMRRITRDQARVFYRREYVIKPRFHEILDAHLRELVVDAGVHHGQRHAAKWLQAAASDESRGIRLAQDGRVGALTLAAVNGADPLELYLWLVAYRVRLFGRLVSQDPELARARRAGFNLQASFSGGWNNRAAEFLEAAARRLETVHNTGAHQ